MNVTGIGGNLKPISQMEGNQFSQEKMAHLTKMEKAWSENAEQVIQVPKEFGKEEAKIYSWLIETIPTKELLSNIDIPLLKQLTTTLFILDQCDAEIRKHGILIEDDKGNLKENPATKIKNTAQGKLNQFAMQFGLSPSSRAGLAIKHYREENKEEDPLSAILKGI